MFGPGEAKRNAYFVEGFHAGVHVRRFRETYRVNEPD